jgi:hypothetical protein
MSSPALEAFLARLYIDQGFRERFLAGTLTATESRGLSDQELAALDRIDRVGLQMMSDSLRAKKGDRSHR